MVRISQSIEDWLQRAMDIQHEGVSGELKTEFYLRLIDFMLSTEAPEGLSHRQTLLSTLLAIMPDVSEAARDQMIKRVMARKKVATDILSTLSHDDAERVKELLRNAQFDEDELIELIENTSNEHARIIAERSDLPANVWIALSKAPLGIIEHKKKPEPLSLAAYRDVEADGIQTMEKLIREIASASERLSKKDSPKTRDSLRRNLDRLELLAQK